jgi:hypothetical protein
VLRPIVSMLAFAAWFGVSCGDPAQPTAGDPSVLDCGGSFVADAFVEATSSYATPRQAAAEAAAHWRPDIADDAEIIRLEPGGTRFAVRVDGRTVLILRIEGEGTHWSVGGYTRC